MGEASRLCSQKTVVSIRDVDWLSYIPWDIGQGQSDAGRMRYTHERKVDMERYVTPRKSEMVRRGLDLNTGKKLRIGDLHV
ncbi:hypothetical protein chiPu_0019338 [Chiloscyllium punctatum]|uniref:Uncharacterized protein n=1 Tax=Chiloscyllium punctatum TaxID=137246 RepID=A0A401RRK0_CHIPU|nr:hypothetical protein [Chiloscyllium punctatum]